MEKFRNRRESGEVSFGSIFITVCIAALGWLGFRFSQIYVEKSRIETLLTSQIFQSKDLDDDALATKVVGEITRTMSIKVSPERVFIYRTADRKRIRIDVSYDAPVRLMDKGWDMTMEASIAESLDRHF